MSQGVELERSDGQLVDEAHDALEYHPAGLRNDQYLGEGVGFALVSDGLSADVGEPAETCENADGLATEKQARGPFDVLPGEVFASLLGVNGEAAHVGEPAVRGRPLMSSLSLLFENPGEILGQVLDMLPLSPCHIHDDLGGEYANRDPLCLPDAVGQGGCVAWRDVEVEGRVDAEHQRDDAALQNAKRPSAAGLRSGACMSAFFLPHPNTDSILAREIAAINLHPSYNFFACGIASHQRLAVREAATRLFSTMERNHGRDLMELEVKAELAEQHPWGLTILCSSPNHPVPPNPPATGLLGSLQAERIKGGRSCGEIVLSLPAIGR